MISPKRLAAVRNAAVMRDLRTPTKDRDDPVNFAPPALRATARRPTLRPFGRFSTRRAGR